MNKERISFCFFSVGSVANVTPCACFKLRRKSDTKHVPDFRYIPTFKTPSILENYFANYWKKKSFFLKYKRKYVKD